MIFKYIILFILQNTNGWLPIIYIMLSNLSNHTKRKLTKVHQCPPIFPKPFLSRFMVLEVCSVSQAAQGEGHPE